MAVVKNLMTRAGFDASGMRKGIRQATREVDGFKRYVTRTVQGIAATIATISIGAAIRSVTKEAMEFEASLQQINRLMGDSAGAFTRWAETEAKSLGFARSEAVRFGAVYANLLSGFSRSTAETMQRTQDLLRASAVVASATGRTMEDVMERIRSGLLGNTEAIEDLGINVNIALIESTKAFQQFANGKSWNQLDFNVQQTIRYFAILEQAASKYGLELANNTATRQAIFVAHLKDARLNLGQAFLPIYNVVLPALTRMAEALANVTRFIAEFSQALFGSNVQQQTATVQNQANAVADLGDAYEKAGKKAKGAVAGFDQVNLVSQGGDGAGALIGAAGGGVVAGASAAFSEMTESMDGVSSKAQEMAAKFKEAIGGMKEFLNQNKEIIIAGLAGIAAGLSAVAAAAAFSRAAAGISALAAAVRGLANPVTLVALVVAALTAGFVYLYRNNEEFRDAVDAAWARIREIMVSLWENVLVPFGDWLADALPKAWEAVASAAQWVWDEVLAPFGAWLADVLPKAWDAVTTAAQWLWENVLEPFGRFLEWFWHEVLVPVGRVIGEALVIAFETLTEVAKIFWEKVLVPLGNALSEMFVAAVEAVSAVLTALWENVLVPFGKFIANVFQPIIEALIDVFEWLWDNVLKPLARYMADSFVKTFESVAETVGGVIDGLKETFIGLMTFITGVFTSDWQTAWDGVKQIFKGVFDSLWAVVKHPLNQIIDGVNALIRGLNRISIDVPDWVASLAGVQGGKFGFNIPQIPKLDTGTNYVARDGLAFLHEGEAVVPKEYNPAAGGMVANGEMLRMLERIEQAVRDLKYIQAVIAEGDVGRAATNYIRAESRRGRAPLQGV